MGCSTARSDPDTPDIDQRTGVKMDSTDDEHCDNVQLVFVLQPTDHEPVRRLWFARNLQSIEPLSGQFEPAH
ncbi:unnamed protein product [Nippostrongylus brasiliensis]|uniref:PITH domain-containing protein n=1 Tax=Nippostrongylus brasiliensis TaxID=27835 RepID=A0A0N4XYD4_NIPBR|nr:unnamed protein product [Nippostrongylus brasiliensis]